MIKAVIFETQKQLYINDEQYQFSDSKDDPSYSKLPKSSNLFSATLSARQLGMLHLSIAIHWGES